MSMPGVSYHHLDWDSQFFGFPVGTVIATEQRHADIRSLLTNIIQSPPCRLLYLQVETEDSLTCDYVTQLGARLVDHRVVFHKTIKICSPEYSFKVNEPFEEFIGKDSNELNKLVFLAGTLSRFRVDPEISETDFQRLYVKWIERSVSGTIADKVLISRDQNNEPASLITLSCKHGIGSIGLIAVRADQQGKGLGAQLINQALQFFADELCTAAEVVTQGNNTAACKLYERSGFAEFKSTLTYHLWLPFPLQ